ncbi:chorismate mutase 2 [Euphorbia peplus]|nr:chorismate mutase 2 [Euphorbia peplus]
MDLLMVLFLLFLSLCTVMGSDDSNVFTLDSIRDSLVRQEDSIVFSLIERAKFPKNSLLYDQNSSFVHGSSGSLFHSIFQQIEDLQAKAGRYENPEENAFFPDGLPHPIVPVHNYSQILYPEAAEVNLNKNILDMYFNQLLPLFVADGDDGNYASTASSDINCLQALSRRIHFGKFVAEIKYQENKKEYNALIQAKNKDAMMKLLTVESVEEQVKKRVEKKATVFGQDVTLANSTSGDGKLKVDPSVVFQLYSEWVIPLTKDVEVEYLLRRLN